MDLGERVATALRNYGAEKAPAADQELAILDRLGYALGWVVAGAIVAARYGDSALDALPVCHPERGWDRFLLTRRVSCDLLAGEPADSFGLLLLDGEDAPRLANPDGSTRLALGPLLRDDPERAIARALDLLPPVGLVEGDHNRCDHVRAEQYPTLYTAIAELILEHPGLLVAREIYVPAEAIDGGYHPILLHTARSHGQTVYGWFGIEGPQYAAFCRIGGEYAIYETDAGNWSGVRKQLAEEDQEGMKRRIRAWLRLAGQPDPAVD